MGHSGYVVALIKFVKEKQHAQDFLDGNLFFKTWVSFKNAEDEQRKDSLELAASKLQTRIYLEKVNELYSLWLEDEDNQFTPIFCMYHLSSRSPLSLLKSKINDERLKDFGDYAVLVRNTTEFINRINRCLSGFSYGLVNYIDYENLPEEDLYALRNPILQKDLLVFKHQKEFRIYNMHYAITNRKDLDDPTKEIITPNQYGGTFLPIGSIEDIADLYCIDELFSGVEVEVENPILRKSMSKELWWDGKNYQEIHRTTKL